VRSCPQSVATDAIAMAAGTSSASGLDASAIVAKCQDSWFGATWLEPSNASSGGAAWNSSQLAETGGSPWLLSSGGLLLPNAMSGMDLADAPDLGL